MTSVMSVIGMLTKNVVRHPQAWTSTPPMGSPIAAVTSPAMTRPPRTLPGGVSRPA
jgi:hypothetical protein